ncbi:MAG: hypothetical protein QOG53_1520 [Frankiales bacterium]|nr:hypothetical protein [Frankiales bacterium]
MSAPGSDPAVTPDRMRFDIDAWDPGYGSSRDGTDDLDPSSAQVRINIEASPRDWAAVQPCDVERPTHVLFVDGVRRIDARVWVHQPDGAAVPGIAASYAAGVVCCTADRATMLTSDVRRGLFTAAADAQGIDTRAGSYPLRPSHDSSIEELSLALQRRLADSEVDVSNNARAQLADRDPATVDIDLLVVDGPLRGRTHLPRVLGLVKTHRATYLAEEQSALITTLAAGERTPVFLIGTSWDRYSWYLRLPCPPGQPWAGVVRVEAPAELDAAAAIALADLSQVVLCRYASCEYKDTRAPQNLYPIGGLERALRRRLGDPALLYRALRAAAQA